MTVRLLVNENFPAPALQVLRERGLDVMAITDLSGFKFNRDELYDR